MTCADASERSSDLLRLLHYVRKRFEYQRLRFFARIMSREGSFMIISGEYRDTRAGGLLEFFSPRRGRPVQPLIILVFYISNMFLFRQNNNLKQNKAPDNPRLHLLI